MKLLLKISTILLFFLLVFVVIPNPVQAVDLPEDAIKQLLGDPKNKTPQDYAMEFCKKRSGELMNLETWFSGKCGEDVDTLSGEGVGFVDIIILQFYEWWYGPQTKGYIETLMDYVNNLEKIKEGLSNEPEKTTLEIQTNNKDVVSQLEQITKILLVTKPARTSEYVNHLSQNLKKSQIIPDAYAATGAGFDALSPLLPVWKAFRNIAYMLFAIAFILYGIMIMFRIKIDNKTAASITLAIPKLVSTLILITFSYAIVGLLVDISTVFSALLIDVLRLGNIITDSSGIVITHVSGQGWSGGFGSFLINWVTSLILAPAIVLNLIFGGVLTVILAIPTYLTYFTAIGNVLGLALTIAIAISYFKLIVKLFQSYISVIVSLIFSPIILIGNLFPGSDTFGKWFMSIVANLAVFPITSFFLVLSYVLMIQPLLNIPVLGPGITAVTGIQSLTAGWDTFWTPPMTSVGNGFAGLSVSLVGIGLLLMASKYVDMILEGLKVSPFKYGTTITDALKGGAKLSETVLTSTVGRTNDRTRTARNLNKTISSIP